MRRCTWLVWVPLAVGAWTPAPGLAQDTGPEDPDRLQVAREHMERGQELYLQSQFAEAAAEFQAAYEAQPFSAFLYNTAVAFERNREWDRAANFFARYVERDPEAGDVAAVRQRIEQLRTWTLRERGAGTNPAPGTDPGQPDAGVAGQVGPGPQGPDAGTPGPAPGPAVEAPPQAHAVAQDMKALLTIRTNPDGAQVTVRRGTTAVASGPAPFAQTLDEGEYRVVVEHPDYRTIQQEVRIRAGVMYVLFGEMSQGQFLGLLRVISSVPGASVYVDNREHGALGQTPFQNAISTGRHHVWIERPGYETVERDVEVGLGEEVEVETELTRVSHGRIQVIANVRGATVSVDDREVGRVPYDGEVSAGMHRITVAADGMKDWEQGVSVPRGQLVPMRVHLRPAQGRGGAWVTATLAAVFVAGGAVMGSLSNNLADELTEERDAGRLANNDPRLLSGQILAIAADVSWGLGALFTGLAIYYFLRDPLPDSTGSAGEPRDWALAPELGPGRAGGAFRWSF